MNKVLNNILKYLFEIKKPILNFILIFFMLFLIGIFKLGLILQKEITQENVFQVWVWAFTIIILMVLLIGSSFCLEGFFNIIGAFLLLLLILPTSYFKPQIAPFLLELGIVGYLFYHFIYKKKNG